MTEEVRKAARAMDKQFAEEKKQEGKYENQVAEEAQRLDEFVAQVRKAIEIREITGTLLLSKITRTVGCTPTTAEKIKSIIQGGI